MMSRGFCRWRAISFQQSAAANRKLDGGYGAGALIGRTFEVRFTLIQVAGYVSIDCVAQKHPPQLCL